MQLHLELPTLFAMLRHHDETGISGTGRVLDGVIFHTGQVVESWYAGAPTYTLINPVSAAW